MLSRRCQNAVCGRRTCKYPALATALHLHQHIGRQGQCPTAANVHRSPYQFRLPIQHRVLGTAVLGHAVTSSEAKVQDECDSAPTLVAGMTISHDVAQCLTSAYQEAAASGRPRADPPHVLLACLRHPACATLCDTLREAGITVDSLRAVLNVGLALQQHQENELGPTNSGSKQGTDPGIKTKQLSEHTIEVLYRAMQWACSQGSSTTHIGHLLYALTANGCFANPLAFAISYMCCSPAEVLTKCQERLADDQLFTNHNHSIDNVACLTATQLPPHILSSTNQLLQVAIHTARSPLQLTHLLTSYKQLSWVPTPSLSLSLWGRLISCRMTGSLVQLDNEEAEQLLACLAELPLPTTASKPMADNALYVLQSVVVRCSNVNASADGKPWTDDTPWHVVRDTIRFLALRVPPQALVAVTHGQCFPFSPHKYLQTLLSDIGKWNTGPGSTKRAIYSTAPTANEVYEVLRCIQVLSGSIRTNKNPREAANWLCKVATLFCGKHVKIQSPFTTAMLLSQLLDIALSSPDNVIMELLRSRAFQHLLGNLHPLTIHALRSNITFDALLDFVPFYLDSVSFYPDRKQLPQHQDCIAIQAVNELQTGYNLGAASQLVRQGKETGVFHSGNMASLCKAISNALQFYVKHRLDATQFAAFLELLVTHNNWAVRNMQPGGMSETTNEEIETDAVNTEMLLRSINVKLAQRVFADATRTQLPSTSMEPSKEGADLHAVTTDQLVKAAVSDIPILVLQAYRNNQVTATEALTWLCVTTLPHLPYLPLYQLVNMVAVAAQIWMSQSLEETSTTPGDDYDTCHNLTSQAATQSVAVNGNPVLPQDAVYGIPSSKLAVLNVWLPAVEDAIHHAVIAMLDKGVTAPSTVPTVRLKLETALAALVGLDTGNLRLGHLLPSLLPSKRLTSLHTHTW